MCYECVRRDEKCVFMRGRKLEIAGKVPSDEMIGRQKVRQEEVWWAKVVLDT